jgi:hypothetical protein
MVIDFKSNMLLWEAQKTTLPTAAALNMSEKHYEK